MIGRTYNLSILNQHLKDINPLICGWEHCAGLHSYGPACRDYYLLHYIVSGRGIFERGGRRTPLYSGNLFLLRPGELCFYQADESDPWYYIWIGFNGERCAEFLSKTDFCANRSTIEAPYLADVFEQIRINAQHKQASELTLLAQIYEIFALMQENHTEKERHSKYVARTSDFIRANYAMPVSISAMARMIGIDRRYLCRIFSAQVGMTPKEFLIHTRLTRAAAFLADPALSIGEIARSVGYEDTFHFSKMFKKKYGVSPLHYRQNNR